MTPIQSNLESVLCASYQKEAILYRKALEAARHIQEALQRGQAVQTEMQALADLMKEISEIETSFFENKKIWKQSGNKPGPQLQVLLTEVADLIQDLLAAIGEAEKQAQFQADSLGPQLDSLIRERKMRRAYGGVMAKGRSS